MAATLPRYRFTADDYRAMVRSGILAEDARVELVADIFESLGSD